MDANTLAGGIADGQVETAVADLQGAYERDDLWPEILARANPKGVTACIRTILLTVNREREEVARSDGRRYAVLSAASALARGGLRTVRER